MKHSKTMWVLMKVKKSYENLFIYLLFFWGRNTQEGG
jgi:hypothetical protein